MSGVIEQPRVEAPPTPPRRPWYRRWLFVVPALAVLVGAGALAGVLATRGPSPVTNGLEHKTSQQVLATAVATVRSAGSVHIVGPASLGRGAVRQATADLIVQPDAFSGSFVFANGRVDLIRLGDVLYMRGDRAGYRAMGAPPLIMRNFIGRWVSGPANQLTSEFTPATMATDLQVDANRLGPTVTQTSLDGQKVVVISTVDGGKMYLANAGQAYPVRTVDWKQPGTVDYGEWSVHHEIKAPPDAVPYDTVRP